MNVGERHKVRRFLHGIEEELEAFDAGLEGFHLEAPFYDAVALVGNFGGDFGGGEVYAAGPALRIDGYISESLYNWFYEERTNLYYVNVAGCTCVAPCDAVCVC